MGERARTHALQFSWEHSMDDLFGRVYPAALARRAERVHASPAISGAPLVGA